MLHSEVYVCVCVCVCVCAGFVNGLLWWVFAGLIARGSLRFVDVGGHC